jgi:hypothetical protein
MSIRESFLGNEGKVAPAPGATDLAVLVGARALGGEVRHEENDVRRDVPHHLVAGRARASLFNENTGPLSLSAI